MWIFGGPKSGVRNPKAQVLVNGSAEHLDAAYRLAAEQGRSGWQNFLKKFPREATRRSAEGGRVEWPKICTWLVRTTRKKKHRASKKAKQKESGHLNMFQQECPT